MNAPIAIRASSYAPVAPDPVTFEITTRLAAPAGEVWARAVTFDGVNEELGPLLSMSRPHGVSHAMTIDDIPLGEPFGRCWIRLLRVLPLDYDDLCLSERGPGMRFLERSRLGSASSWQHEREVLAIGAAECELTDRLELVPRAPLGALCLTPLAARIVRALFTHRHRRLAGRWGHPL